jgi:short-subunit dehydrogenase
MPTPTNQTRLYQQYGPWAVITGASEGIGRAFALALAQAGLSVVLVARRLPVLDELAAHITQQHRVEAVVIEADLTRDADVEHVAEITRPLPVGLLVACAGYGTTGPLTETHLQSELDMLSVNCRAVLMMAHHFGQRLIAQRRGGLVLMGSLLGFQGVPMSANYAATKAYVQSLAEGLHAEFAPYGVDVVSSAPGPVHTGFAARASMKMGMAGQPETVAAATLQALGRKVTVTPGWFSKLLTYSMAPLPRGWRTLILGRVVQSMMIQNQTAQTKG